LHRENGNIFEHKVAVVTGAGRGIGAAIALALAQRGALVAIADLDLERAQGAARTIRMKGLKAEASGWMSR